LSFKVKDIVGNDKSVDASIEKADGTIVKVDTSIEKTVTE
jgi:hypothetical protein